MHFLKSMFKNFIGYTLLEISIDLTGSGVVASNISTRFECSSPSRLYHSTNLYIIPSSVNKIIIIIIKRKSMLKIINY